MYNIFISYRGKSTGAIYGDSLYKSILMTDQSGDFGHLAPFFAPACIDKMQNFHRVIHDVIRQVKVLVLLLTPGFFDGCASPDDQVLFELKTALENEQLEILPVFFPGFSYGTAQLHKYFSDQEISRFRHINPLHFRDIYDINSFYQQQFLPSLLKALDIRQSVHVIDREQQRRYLCHELKKVFPARHNFQNVYDMSVIIDSAESIECLGISNNELTLNLGVANLRRAIERGCRITMLFLDPQSPYNAQREDEEHQRRGNIASNTVVTINQAVRACGGRHHDNVRLMKYSAIPRLNLVFIDHRELYLQYYAPTVEGYNNPTFVFERDPEGGKNSVFDFYYRCFEAVCRTAEEIDQEDQG